MFFARKNLFSATDAFPLTDAVLEFDDSSSAASAAVRPGRRAVDGLGPRGDWHERKKWWAVSGLIALYGLALGGFYALGMVAGEASFDVVNPATAKVFAQAPDAGEADLDRAVASAAPSMRPTVRALLPSTVTMKSGNRLWIISDEISISMLTKPNTQTPRGIWLRGV